MKKTLIFLFGCFILSLTCIAQTSVPDTIYAGKASASSEGKLYNVIGEIVDETDESTIVGATIQVLNMSGGTVSNEDGEFRLRLPAGTYDFTIRYLGYEDFNVHLSLYKDVGFTLGLKPSSVQLEQVVITDKAANENIEAVVMGVETMDIKRLESRSQLFGETDVLRSIQSLSGVTSVGDGASGFNVRGGNSDENLILQDDALILNPTHTLGFFSLFHPDLIESVDLYKGNQPAYYGGRLSSVLKVGLREGSKEKMKVRGGIGMAASRLTVEGPIVKDKASFIVGARLGYMNYLLNAVNNIDVRNSSSSFYDVTFKADARVTEKTKIGFSSFISGDDFQFADEVNFDYTTRTGTFYINQLISDRFNVTLNANIGEYESSLFDIQGNDLSRFTNKVSFFRPSIRGLYEVKEGLELTAGVSYDSFDVSPGSLTPEGEGSTAIPESLPNELGNALSPFAQVDWSINDKLSFSASARYTNYNRVGPGEVLIYRDGFFRNDFTVEETQTFGEGDVIASFGGWEPRVSLRYALSETASIKAGYNRGFQYLNQISNTASSTPVDIWKLSDTYTRPQTSSNYNLGFFKNFENNAISSSVEAFYRDQDRIIEYRDFADLLLNPNLERELVEGVGRSFGVEANFKYNKGDVQWEVNYTFSRSFRKVLASDTQLAINNGDWFASNFDKPHSLNMNMTKKLSRITSLSLNFTYSTGRPITAPVSNFSIDNVLNIPIFSERNQFRIPDYHRLDVSYSIGPFGKTEKGQEHKLVFSIYNLYSRRNAYSVFFRQVPSRSISVFRISTLGSIFPSLTYNFQF